MSTTPQYDVIVVGAGIEGSSAAYHLAKRGENTLLLEQFPLPHSRGSSHGATRITRRAYPQDYYTEMMIDSYKLWEILEQETNTKLYYNCGTIYIGPDADLDSVKSSLKKHNGPHRLLTSSQIESEFPAFSVPTDYTGVYDNDGGILMADKSLLAFQKQFQVYGGTLLDGQQVTDIIPGDTVIVRTQNATYTARNIVLALGPYTNKLLNTLQLQLPLKVERISVLYWKEKIPGLHSYEKFPCFIERNMATNTSVYSLPSFEYPGLVKVCLHAGPSIDPHVRDEGRDTSTWVIDRMCKYISTRLPWLQPTPAIVETCMYTVTPDADLIIDRHPKYDNIVIAAGFSGHGFKLAPAVGKLVSDLVLKQTPNIDDSNFKISRFTDKTRLKVSRL